MWEINTIMYYSVSILLQAHIGTVQQSIWLAVPVAAAQLVGCITGGLLIDRVGRRPLVLFSLIGAALSLGLEGSTFLLDGTFCNATSPPNGIATASAAADDDGSSTGGGYDTLCRFKGWFSIGGMVIYLLCFGVGMSPVPWALNAEIYPMRVRTVCMGIATASNWVYALSPPMYFTVQPSADDPLLAHHHGPICSPGCNPHAHACMCALPRLSAALSR